MPVSFQLPSFIKPATPPPARPQAQGPRAQAPATSGDTFVRQASPRLDLAGRERLATRLIADMDKLTWAANPSEKLRLLSAIASLRIDAAVPVVIKEYQAGMSGLTPARQEAMARVFYNLVPPATKPGDQAISPEARDTATAFLLKEFNTRAGDVHHVLGYGLALTRTNAAEDAIIKDYQAHPAQGGMSLNKPLMVLGYCPTPRVTEFLLGEYERLAGNEEARMQILDVLQGVLKDAP